MPGQCIAHPQDSTGEKLDLQVRESTYLYYQSSCPEKRGGMTMVISGCGGGEEERICAGMVPLL